MLGRLLTGKLPVQGHRIVVVDEGEEKKKTNRKEKRPMRREGKGEWKYARRRGEADVYFNDGDWWKIRSDKKETSEVYNLEPCTQVNTNTSYRSINIHMIVPHNTQFQCRSIKWTKYLAEVNV